MEIHKQRSAGTATSGLDNILLKSLRKSNIPLHLTNYAAFAKRLPKDKAP